MSAGNVEEILTKLDSLTSQNLRLYEMIEDTNKKIDCLDAIHIKNGGGRDVTFKRSEFFQMIYDRPKEQFTQITDNAKRLNNVADLIWKVASVGALIFAAIKLGT